MDDVTIQWNEAANKIQESKSKFVQEGSAWNRVDKIDCCTVKYQPLFGNSYVPTPKEISHSKYGILNILNKDNKGFVWQS